MEIDVATKIKTVDEILTDRFSRLEEELKTYYFWCKIKLHIYGALILGSLWWLK